MPDPYTPLLTAFALDAAESAAVAAAMETADPWGWDSGGADEAAALQSAKNKIRAFHLARHGDTCCYCRSILFGGGHFVIDREHILPKGKYKPYSYTIWNLSASCKRCNMQYKGSDDSFVVNKVDAALFEAAENYTIVHPNFDKWDDHLDRETYQKNSKILVTYRIVGDSAKGLATYQYFDLEGLVTNSFDEAQGKGGIDAMSEAGLETLALAKAFGQ